MQRNWLLGAIYLLIACSGNNKTGNETSGGTVSDGGANSGGAANGGGKSSGGSASGGSKTNGGSPNGGAASAGSGNTGPAPTIADCQILPSNHIFNTPIDALPVHPSSSQFITTVGAHNIHLDLGTSTDPTSDEYWGIPYNIVHGNSLTWVQAPFISADPDLDWDAAAEADCANGSAHTLQSPCTTTKPLFPIPANPLIEGGIDTDPSQPYGDHHMLLLDADTCRLWELYHCYPGDNGSWDIYGAATFDLNSTQLRHVAWTSADAAGFPILPLLLRADEASAGAIHHALRFTIDSSHIRAEYTWPARHITGNNSSANAPPMGQLFRIKASYAIPASFNTQARAIVQALKTYGMYLADGGSAMYIQGEPSADWADDTFSQVQSISSAQFEAVDLTPITQRSGFDPDSAAVP